MVLEIVQCGLVTKYDFFSISIEAMFNFSNVPGGTQLKFLTKTTKPFKKWKKVLPFYKRKVEKSKGGN